MKKNALMMIGLFALLFTFSSCGGGGDTSSSEGATAEKPKSMIAEPEAPIEVSADGSTVTVRLTGDDMMKYNLNKIEVKAGQKINLTLTHTGKMKKEVMGHNFVLLKPGVDVDAFATEATKHKDSDYIPTNMEGDIIAHTSLVGGGESTSVSFDAPAPGTYKYICSFPAHHITMNGELIVN
ncbi:MAG: cupredoxin domain-containing protein [Phaeodactylibacter sp.]|nr:cupredoxin domain-containing protein [Phaeodactylibacter sp.]